MVANRVRVFGWSGERREMNNNLFNPQEQIWGSLIFLPD